MLVLDTDVLTLVQNGDPAAERLRMRVVESGRTAYVTIVTFEEQVRGRLAECSRANTAAKYAQAAERLRATYEDYRGRNILDFTTAAAAEFDRLKQLKVRIGTMDLRIAAITLAHSATLITRNRRDFEKVPGLNFADWTA